MRWLEYVNEWNQLKFGSILSMSLDHKQNQEGQYYFKFSNVNKFSLYSIGLNLN